MTTQKLPWIPRAVGILLALSGAANGQFTPAPGSPFPAGSGAYSVAVGDFNGDGKLDLAIADYGGNNLTVLLGDGTGGFTAAPGSPFPAGTSPFSVAVGDFNADGKPDLAIANWGSGNVTVLLGDGTGRFTAAPGSPFAVGLQPSSVAVGDFNGDGKPDLAIVSHSNDYVTVLLGNGAGGFTAAPGSPFPVGTTPFTVAVGDFNGDGKPDLAIANYGSDNVTVLLGDGKGGFTAAPGSPFTVGIGPKSVAVGDFNGDGKPDLAITNYSGGTLTVLLGNGTGGFTAAPGSPYGAGTGSAWVAVADFDGDGKLDLAIADWGSDNVTVLLGNGAGGFTAAPGSPFPAGVEPETLAVGDFNGDGKPDLAIANYGGNNVTVLLNSFPPQPPVLVSPSNGATGVSLNPTLSWSRSTFATSYDVYLGTSSPPPLFTNTTGTSDVIGTLNAGTTYYWRVVAKNSSGSNTSAVWSFTTVPPLPPAPVLTSPANGATGVSLTPTLTWNASAGATSYDVYFGTAPSVLPATNTTGTSYSPGTLTAGTTYIWQVVAKNSGGSAGSVTWSFTTQVAPSVDLIAMRAYLMTGPDNGSVVTTPSVGQTVYFILDFQLTGASGSVSVPARALLDGVLFCSVTMPSTNGIWTGWCPTGWVATAGSHTLEWDLNYTHSIVETNYNNDTATAVFSATGGPPAAPVLASPANGATGVSISPGLFWNASAGATSYNVYLGTSPSPPLVGATASTAYTPGTLSVSTTYYWYVVAMNNGAASSPSATWSFTTQASAPPAPVLTSPANGATGVSLTPGLFWNASPGATYYYVYFGTTPSPPLVGSTAATAYTPGTLSAGTTYYWYVVTASNPSATWSFTTGGPTGLRFVPVTPCRVVDTRNPSGTFGGPSMTAGQTRSFPIPQSACNVPSTAQAYSLNVTVVPEGPLSYLTLWPSGQPQPFVSTLNSWGGIVVANAAIVPAGIGEAVSVYVTNPTDVILDIDGYFDTSSGANSYSFYPATPCRVADTRNPTGQFGGPSMYAGQSRDFPIPLSSCAIPATARAYSLNVTVVPEGPLSYLTLWPTGQIQPLVSTLNSWTGKVVANAAIVPAGSNESISVFVTNPTDVVLDIDGYFAAPGSAGALTFYPVAPCRVADTRNANGPFGGPEMGAQSTRSFTVPASGCNIPSTAAAYSLNVTVVPDGILSYLTAWPTGLSQPLVSTLNSWDGSVVANAAIVPAGTNGAISIYVTNPTHVILDINGYFAP